MTINLTDKEYRALPMESYSSLKSLLSSPKDYKFFKENPFTGNDSTLLGTAIHHFIQGNRHLVLFKNKSVSAAFKEVEQQFQDSVGGEGVIVPQRFEEQISSIMKNFNENKVLTDFIAGAEFEKPYFGVVDGVRVKGKLDIETDKYIGDIKTTSASLDTEDFRKYAQLCHYDMQAALYQKLVGTSLEGQMLLKPYYIMVISTKEPYQNKLFKCGESFLESGKQKINISIDRFKRYILNNEEWEESNNIEEL